MFWCARAAEYQYQASFWSRRDPGTSKNIDHDSVTGEWDDKTHRRGWGELKNLPAAVIVGLGVLLMLFVARTAVGYRMIFLVNEKLSPEEQYSYFVRYPTRSVRIRRTYRQLFPTGRLYAWTYIVDFVTILWVACLFLFPWE
jgi:hypothetical protein